MPYATIGRDERAEIGVGTESVEVSETLESGDKALSQKLIEELSDELAAPY